MPRIQRATGFLVTTMLLFGGCSGSSLTSSPSAHPTTSPTDLPTARATITASPSVAVRPGYILLEHFGNAADGTELADTGARHLWLVKADGSDLHELAPGKPGPSKGAAGWSPDGMHIAFNTDETGVMIYETNVAGSRLRLISTGCDPSTCLEIAPAYSPDGTRLAFDRLADSPAGGVIGIRDLATTKVKLLESTRQLPPKSELGAPAWSPDGAQLVYYETAKDADGRPTGSSELFIVNADGTGRHALKTPDLAAGDPHWSPDGRWIVFSTHPVHEWNDAGVTEPPDIYVVHPDGSGLQALTNDGGSAAPSWTLDGRILFFSQRALWLMDADGSNRERVGPGTMNLVSDTTGYSYYASWQPLH
jgi:Tol biopolymer transport system component